MLTRASKELPEIDRDIFMIALDDTSLGMGQYKGLISREVFSIYYDENEKIIRGPRGTRLFLNFVDRDNKPIEAYVYAWEYVSQ